MLREMTRTFADQELAPIAGKTDKAGVLRSMSHIQLTSFNDKYAIKIHFTVLPAFMSAFVSSDFSSIQFVWSFQNPMKGTSFSNRTNFKNV